MPDNLADIKDNFEYKEDARFAGGYAYFCHHCGLECNVGEAGFDCQGAKILPIYIKCRYGCGKSWHLRVLPTGSTSIQ
ncbi:MAG: hypothetical protein PVH34_13285 [Syntrophobacterales bacterium]